MNFFEQELRKLFQAQYPDATFVGRHCFVPLGDQIRANICFRTSGYADHYDTLNIKILDRKEGTIDTIGIKLVELLGKKQSYSKYLTDGVSPHIWVNGNTTEWYGFKPSTQDYSQMREAAIDYMQVFQEPELTHNSGMAQQRM